MGLLLTLGMMLMMFPGIAAASFTAATDSTTANGVAALGLTGTTATTSDNTVATADLTTVSGYVTITSVSAGTASITVSDGTNNATIPVTVAANGAITIGTITPYTAPAVTFTSATDSTTANDADTLGLEGTTATTSDDTVATANLTAVSGYVTITSVSAGTATITVSDGANSATIPVTVAANGAITIGTVEPYAASAVTFTATTDSTTANDIDTLGLTGTTATTSDDTVATADLTTDSGYVTITSVSAGTATITVSDGTNNATMPVTVATDGEITIGTITPSTSSSPTVQTADASTITDDSSFLNGDITSNNGYDITDYGFLWGTSSDSLTNKLDAGTDNHSGTFTANLSNLSAGTLYYFQAYATNSAGTADGEVIRFTTTTLAAPITANVPVLSDVPASYWGYDAISNLSSKGIVSGYPDGTFKPDDSITRAEFATMLVKALGLSTTETTSKFTDVSADVWYNGILNAAVSASLVSGMDDNLFAPNTLITREQMAVMASKALGEKAPAIDGTELNAFGDKSAISSWAVSGMSEAVKAGIVNGTTTDTLAPVANATRAQAAEMINKLLTILGK